MSDELDKAEESEQSQGREEARKEASEEQIISDCDDDDVKDIEDFLIEMKELLENQVRTKTSKYTQIIRESVEFFLDEEENFDGYEDDESIESEEPGEDYEELK